MTTQLDVLGSPVSECKPFWLKVAVAKRFVTPANHFDSI